jgi:hypothetical protein
MDDMYEGKSGCLWFKSGSKVNVKLSRYHRADAKGEMSYSFYSFLTSALDRGEWSVSRPGCTLLRYPLARRLGEPESWSGHRG